MSKKVTMLAVCFGLAAGPVFAGPAVADAEKKTEVSVQPTGEHMSDAQKQNLEMLKKELVNIQASSEVTDAQKESLAKSLSAITEGATKPSEESVQALASSLSAAKADGEVAPEEAMKIAQDLSTVFNSANVSTDEVKAAVTDVQTIMEASGVDKATVEKLVADLMVIGEEMQKKDLVSFNLG